MRRTCCASLMVSETHSAASKLHKQGVRDASALRQAVKGLSRMIFGQLYIQRQREALTSIREARW